MRWPLRLRSMVGFFGLAGLVLLMVRPVEAGHPFGHPTRRAQPTVLSPTVRQSVPVPTQVVVPARRPRTLGTFRSDPTLVSSNGSNDGGGYNPLGNTSEVATMSVYGPFSRMRSRPTRGTLYGRSPDGRVIATSSGIVYGYSDVRQYRDTSLIPTTYELRPMHRVRPRSRMAPYLLGQQ